MFVTGADGTSFPCRVADGASRALIAAAFPRRAARAYPRDKGGAMPHPAPRLVGRPVELGAFDQILVELEQGRSAAVELVGEAGIGKTRLLAELGRLADARGQLVLSGSASELERDLPFWVFVDALDEYAEGLDPRRLEHLDGQTRAELAHVFPSLSAPGGDAAVGLQ